MSLRQEMETTIGFSAIKNEGCRSNNGHTVGGGGEMRQEWGLGVVLIVGGDDDVGGKNGSNNCAYDPS